MFQASDWPPCPYSYRLYRLGIRLASSDMLLHTDEIIFEMPLLHTLIIIKQEARLGKKKKVFLNNAHAICGRGLIK